MAKADIGYERRLDDGTLVKFYVARSGGEYRFFSRLKRFDNWEPVEKPSIEDWLELLDCVKRRVARRKLMPDEETRLLQYIRRQFPTCAV